MGNITVYLRAYLDGMTFAYDCCNATFVMYTARFKQRSHTTHHSNILIVATTVVRFLKHVSKSYDSLRVVCNCCEDVVRLF